VDVEAAEGALMSNLTAIVGVVLVVLFFHISLVAAVFIFGALYVVAKLIIDGPD
jgi:hypothetical protein